MKEVLALVLAGGPSQDLGVLTQERVSSALPFGGKFRLIDFALSNCTNSGLYQVGVVTQYKPHSLNEHLGTGAAWDLDTLQGGLRVLHPFLGGPNGGWQEGTFDAIRRNMEFVSSAPVEHVLILSGDHAYRMDYRPFIQAHIQSQADMTMAVRKVPSHESYRFGMVQLGSQDKVLRFEEKPKVTSDTQANMGVYVFRKDVLLKLFEEQGLLDFGRDVIPRLLEKKWDVRGLPFLGYWEDLGTAPAYWKANLALIGESPALELHREDWKIRTRSYDRAPVKFIGDGEAKNCLLSNGCQISGWVENSVLSPGVVVGPGAVIKNSVILHDCQIGKNARVYDCILDKKAVVGAEAHIGVEEEARPNQEFSVLNIGLSIIGRSSIVPVRANVGRNVAIASNWEAGAKGLQIKSGQTVGDVDVY